jgi:subtilase family serine protease
VRVTRHSKLMMSLVLSAITTAGLAAVPASASAASGHAQSGQAAAARAGRAAAATTASGLPADERRACPAATQPGQVECQAIYMLAAPGRAAFAAPAANSALDAAYSPANLRGAYRLASASASRGRGETIGIVDAFRDPDAAQNLAVYRKEWHLGACTTKSRCLRIVNQKGKTSPLPRANASWGGEESLDLDMVSAICPKCHIILVEASSTLTSSMGPAENTAVRLGARFVSNSWNSAPFAGESRFNHYFNHKGDAIDFAAGDTGYRVAYPVELGYVTAVGGTSLYHTASGGRSWSESVWGSASHPTSGGTGSGCAKKTAKPSWQKHIGRHGCSGRTENDVAANANPSTGVYVYDTYGFGGWLKFGGTSEATPIITAIYALAGKPARGTYPSSYPYKHRRDFFDVKTGANGSCAAKVRYLCHGEKGYDGPTGVGTPNGIHGLAK